MLGWLTVPRIRLLPLLALCLLPLGCTTTHIASSTPGRSPWSRPPPRCRTWCGNVGGANVHLVGILKPNVDPHDFEPTPAAPRSP